MNCLVGGPRLLVGPWEAWGARAPAPLKYGHAQERDGWLTPPKAKTNWGL